MPRLCAMTSAGPGKPVSFASPWSARILAIRPRVSARWRNLNTAPGRTVGKRARKISAATFQGHPVEDIVRRPLLLRMLFSLYGPYGIPAQINSAQLYEIYWERRVRTDWRAGRPEPEPATGDLGQTALAVAYRMVVEGTLGLSQREINAILVEIDRPPEDLKQLISCGVLRYISSESQSSNVQFFHQTFFEHVAARSILALTGPVGIDLMVNRLRGLLRRSLPAPDIGACIHPCPKLRSVFQEKSAGPHCRDLE